ncbi:transcription elongation factor GreA [Candidatus Uhrbacteria bacterium]|nr:transcription elongation factor GreA [Candidatus Uhrbacteria bacterium]
MGQTYLTRVGLAKLEEELQLLKSVRRKEIAEKIERAKELGDLSENAEYQEAKDEQAFIEGRILELETIINTATVVAAPTGTKQVGIGSTVRVRVGGNEREFTVVGTNEADLAHGRVSHESPIGRALLGHRVKDVVEVQAPRGSMQYEILGIS